MDDRTLEQIRAAAEDRVWAVLEDLFPDLMSELRAAGRAGNRDEVERLHREHPVLYAISRAGDEAASQTLRAWAQEAAQRTGVEVPFHVSITTASCSRRRSSSESP